MVLWLVLAGSSWATEVPGEDPLPAGVAAVLTDAASAGLPTDPLRAKALEGLAKHVPEARLVDALTTMRQALAQADTLVAPDTAGADRAEVVWAASLALRAGCSEGAVSSVARQGGRWGAAALTALSDLHAAGFPEAGAVSFVLAAAGGPQPERAFSGAVTTAVILAQRGVPATEALRMLTIGAAAGQSPSAATTTSRGQGGPPEHARNDEDNPGKGHNK